MKLTPPTQVTFVISLVIALAVLLGIIADVEFVLENDVWLALLAWLVLAVGNVFKDI